MYLKQYCERCMILVQTSTCLSTSGTTGTAENAFQKTQLILIVLPWELQCIICAIQAGNKGGTVNACWHHWVFGIRSPRLFKQCNFQPDWALVGPLRKTRMVCDHVWTCTNATHISSITIHSHIFCSTYPVLPFILLYSPRFRALFMNNRFTWIIQIYEILYIPGIVTNTGLLLV
jgi:hypothetical protein